MTTAEIDFPPIEAPPAKPPAKPPAIADSIAVVQGEVAKFDQIESGLRAIEAAHPKNVIVAAIGTVAGMKVAEAGWRAYRNPRLEVEKARKAAKSPVLALGKAIDTFAGDLETRLRAGEDHYKAQIEGEETRRAAEEAERVAAHHARLATITAYGTRCQKPGMTAERIAAGIEQLSKITLGPEWQEFAGRAAEMQSKTLDAMNALHAQAVEREAADRERAAEAARLEAQRIEQARVAAEQAEAQRKLDEQAAALKADAERIKRLMAMVAEIRAAGTGHEGKSAAELADADQALAAVPVCEAVYQEYHPLAAAAKRDSLMTLYRLHEEAQAREQAAAAIVIPPDPMPEPPADRAAIVNPQFADRFEMFGGAVAGPSADAIVDNPPAAAPADPPAVDVTLALLAALKRLVVTLRAMDAETSAGGVPWEDDYQAALDQADAAIALAEGAA